MFVNINVAKIFILNIYRNELTCNRGGHCGRRKEILACFSLFQFGFYLTVKNLNRLLELKFVWRHPNF